MMRAVSITVSTHLPVLCSVPFPQVHFNNFTAKVHPVSSRFVPFAERNDHYNGKKETHTRGRGTAGIRELLEQSNVGSMEDIQTLFKETIGEFLENGLDAELEEDLGYSKYDYRNKDTDNSRNGHSEKTLCTSFGEVAVSVPRDRKGEFDPQLLKKNQTSISQDIEEKILSMYAKGMSTGDIESHIRDIYGIAVSDTTVSRITDKILPVVKEWQQRPLESVYAVVWTPSTTMCAAKVRL